MCSDNDKDDTEDVSDQDADDDDDDQDDDDDDDNQDNNDDDDTLSKGSLSDEEAMTTSRSTSLLTRLKRSRFT